MDARNMSPHNVRDFYAYFGGEELGVSFENTTIIWDAATQAERLRTSSNKPVTGICRWKLDEYDCYYSTACGKKWVFPDGSPKENGLVFCPVCGKRVKIKGESL